MSTIEATATQWFIDDNPYSLTLSRTTYVDDGEGGTEKVSAGNVGPYVVRLVVQTATRGQTTSDQSGAFVHIEYVIVALAGTDIRRGDRFTYQGEDLVVGRVRAIQDWSVEAEVSTYGG